MIRIGLKILLLNLLFSVAVNAQVQDTISTDTTQVSEVLIDQSDELIGRTINGELVRTFKGDVELRQDNIYMYCDTAVVIDNNVDAVGNVIIQQGDSVTIFADSLSYLGDIKKAYLFGDVALLKDSQKLYTDYMIYNLNTSVATYTNWAILTNDTTQLRSKIGYFYLNQDEAFFKDSVTIVDDDFELKTDTLKYNTSTGVATFLAPTLINQGTGRIYCENGYYDTKARFAEFRGNAQYLKENQKAIADVIHYDAKTETVTLIGDAEFIDDGKVANADTIRYDEKNKLTYLLGNALYVDGDKVVDSERMIYNEATENFETEGRARIVDGKQILDADNIDYQQDNAIATGDVVWIDTVEQVTINSEHLNYNKTTERIVASGGRPLMTSLIEDDTFYMSADTLVSFHENPEDSLRTMLAYKDVRILKSNMQAVADSVTYSSRDSLFELFQNPIVWSDTTQFTADTMFIQLADGKIDRIFLHQKSLILNSSDEVYYNQIKGKHITAYFMESELRRMLVEGNAESIYYALDEEKAYVGLNKTLCSRMLLYFNNNQIEEIRFYAQPKANTYPMGQVSHVGMRLEGFKWHIKKRPNDLSDLLKPRAIPIKPVKEKTDEEPTSDQEATKEVIEGEALLPEEATELLDKAKTLVDPEKIEEVVEQTKTEKENQTKAKAKAKTKEKPLDKNKKEKE
ncbi:MAG: OstA-like protein [Saprospiraceae bacterium]